MFKRMLHNYYGYIALLFVFACIVVAIARSEWWQTTVTFFPLIAAFVYFCQKQALEDFNVFQEHFKAFNLRYDKMNEVLIGIVIEDQTNKLRPEQIKILNDYFNLCAEEYYFFKIGVIYPEAWYAWKAGMLWFYGNERIKKEWDREFGGIGTSYYGFTKDILLEKFPSQ